MMLTMFIVVSFLDTSVFGDCSPRFICNAASFSCSPSQLRRRHATGQHAIVSKISTVRTGSATITPPSAWRLCVCSTNADSHLHSPATLPRPLCDLPRCCGSLSRAGSRTHFLLSLFASDFPPSELAAGESTNSFAVRNAQSISEYIGLAVYSD
ncbi:hypothetical protein B0H10DRAFT_917838 [Mycena sp. CBHHK59/15]|nr:hypothetical protein B0H10DRAFT_917838 [Mycena sp. CBHHK59/15]